MTTATIIRKFNGLHKKIVSKQFVKSFLDDVQDFIRVKRVDSHGPEGAKVIDIKERLTKLLPLVNGTDFRLLIDPKVRITPDLTPLKNKVAAYEKKKRFKHTKRGKKLSGVDISLLEKDYRKKDVKELVKLKKKLYPNPDITSAMSPEEKLLTKIIAEKFSDMNKKVLVRRKRKTFKHKSRGKKLSGNKFKENDLIFINDKKRTDHGKRGKVLGYENDKIKIHAFNGAKPPTVLYLNESQLILRDEKLSGESHIKSLIDDMISNKVYSRSFNMKNENGYTKFINDAKSFIDNKDITVKRNGNKVTVKLSTESLKKIANLSGKNTTKATEARKKKIFEGGYKKHDKLKEAVAKHTPKQSKNLSGVNYKYHEIDLGPYKDSYHRMYSDSVVQLHGLPGHGKTVEVMKQAQDRASRTGDHVLFVAREEFGRSEFDMKLKEFNIGHKNLRFRGNLNENDLAWATVVILDSVTALELTPDKVEKLMHKFPNRNWFLILQSTKDGKFRGSQQWEHLVTIAGEIRNRKLILSKNRLDPDNKDKMAKLRMDDMVHDKTEAMRIRERAKYEATKHKLESL